MSKVTSQHNLSVVNPKLAQEWHPTKNGRLTPKDIAPRSSKKVWWLCNKGHEWEAMPKKRSNGGGCPFFGKKRVCNENCLAVVNPKLASEWHPTRNGNLTPKDVTPRSNRKVWWLCDKNHEYEAVVGNRFMGSGCPYCAGKRVTQKTSLAAQNPQLIKEWHPTKNGTLTPKDITPGSNKNAWWRCSKDNSHEWRAKIYNRTSNQSGCPFCIGRRATSTDNFKISSPNLAKEFDLVRNYPLIPEGLRPNSLRKVWWICQINKEEHRWLATVASRFRGTGCPYCSGHRVCESNSLHKLNPDLANQWHPTKNGELTPKDVVPGFTKKVWWLCDKGHNWQSIVRERVHGCGCPYCGNKKICADNCLAVVNPKLASEWHSVKNGTLTPNDIVPGFTKKVWWVCNQGHDWDATPRQRLNGSGCPCCAKRRVCKENCLAVANPNLAKEWHPTKNGALTPEGVTPNSAQKVWWQCKKGHEWKVGPNGRSSGQKCPFCSNRKACKDNSLATMNPKLASEWHHSKNGYLTPGDVTPGSSKRVWWQCKRNHEWKGSIGNRTRRYGCPYCYFQISSVELRIFTELASIFEDIKQKVKISGAECDIYIPSLKLGIEYDGEYWHRNKNKKDLGKNSLFKKSGVALIRIREVPLPKITQEDIQFNYSKDDKLSLVKDILKKIQKASPLEKKISEKINFYFQKTSFANDKYFQELEELLPSPPAEKSLAFLNPKVAGEWHPTKNGKLRPEDVTPGSGKKVWWQCRKGHACNASPAQRTKGKGCPYCINRKVCNDNCLSTVNPLIASEWHPTKNGKLRPEDVLPFSNTKVWWQCKKGHEWHVAPNGRSRGNNCPNCYHRRRLGGTVSGKQLSFFD